MSQNTSHAVMAQRHEVHDSLDDFPTPPWAGRALMEHVIVAEGQTVWEPACNRGFLARPLTEYFRRVYTSDIFDYGWDGQERVVDFLMPFSESPMIAAQGVDWIITNPPFRLAEQFVFRALGLAHRGVAVLVRTAFLESEGRYSRLFSVRPPRIVAQFVERVPMVKGRFDPDASTATAYCWLVWVNDGHNSVTKFVWIPPCRKALERDGERPSGAPPAVDVAPGLFDE